MAKRIIFFCLMACVLGFVTACSDDLGNYEYHDINEVEAATPIAGFTYNKLAFVDNLTFDPQIESTFGRNNDDDYEFEWKIMPFGKDFVNIPEDFEMVIATTRRIDIPVTWNPGKYSCFFKVKDKYTGVTWTTPFFMQVRSVTAEGWMVLTDKNGESHLDIVFNESEDNDIVARDIWQNQTFKPGRPVRLVFNYTNNASFPMLVTDRSTYIMNQLDLHIGEASELKWYFGTTPEGLRIKAGATALYSVRKGWAVIDENDDIYFLDLSTNGSLFEFPINKLNGTDAFKPAPFIATCIDNDAYQKGYYGSAPFVFYDQTNRQFVVKRNASNFPSAMTYQDEVLFHATTGRDMVHMEATRQGPIYAILKDPADGQLYYYGFTLCATYKEPTSIWQEGEYTEYNVQRYHGKLIGPKVSQAERFACHHQFPYIFYQVGREIYQFDMRYPKEQARLAITLPADEEVVVMRFNPFVAWEAYADWERARGYRLLVATNRRGGGEDCGTMRMYNVPDLMGDLTLAKEHQGFGRIVDIVYKERPKQ